MSDDALRKKGRESLERLVGGDSDAADRLLIDILDMTKDDYVTCIKCGKRTPSSKPDAEKRVKALIAFNEHVNGKLPEKKEVDVNVLVATKLEELEGLSLAELAKMADVIDADWREVDSPPELPPAA